MRIDGSISSISWIPSEAVTGLAKLPFGSGVAHYDQPPPDAIGADGVAIGDQHLPPFRICELIDAARSGGRRQR